MVWNRNQDLRGAQGTVRSQGAKAAKAEAAKATKSAAPKSPRKKRDGRKLTKGEVNRVKKNREAFAAVGESPPAG